MKRILSLSLIITTLAGCSKPDYLLFDGSSGSLEDLNGKWLVINYWADWCPPCIKELPELSSFYEDNKDKVNEYLSGKDKLFGFFVGQVMKLSQGKANPGVVNKLLKEKLK